MITFGLKADGRQFCGQLASVGRGEQIFWLSRCGRASRSVQRLSKLRRRRLRRSMRRWSTEAEVSAIAPAEEPDEAEAAGPPTQTGSPGC
jgi:hypothetical protein